MLGKPIRISGPPPVTEKNPYRPSPECIRDIEEMQRANARAVHAFMRNPFLVGLLALPLMAGQCATTAAVEPRLETVIVREPVAISCVPDSLPAPPAYPDTAEALRTAPGPAERLLLLARGRLMRIQRSAEVEPVVTGCRTPSPP